MSVGRIQSLADLLSVDFTKKTAAIIPDTGPVLTYRELAEQSARLAEVLVKAGISPSDTVVLEAYGATEAANQISCNPLPPQARKIGSVGLPTGVEVSICDDQGCALSAGAQARFAFAVRA